MPSKWREKKDKLAAEEFERNLQRSADDTTVDVVKDAAMGAGDEQIFEKKLSKEEKKAKAKAAREAKRKLKKGDTVDDEEEEEEDAAVKAEKVLAQMNLNENEEAADVDDGIDHDTADALAAAGTICTFAASRKGVDPRSRDINVTNFTLQHMGGLLLDETEVVLNHGNRYGLIGRNGCGKSTLLRAIGARAIPVPRGIDIFYLSEEIEPSDTVTALDAVMAVDEERLRLEQQADDLNHVLTELADKISSGAESDASGKTYDEQQEEVMDALNSIYERLDSLDAATAEVRARGILKGLGFTHEMQGKLTKDFSGGWRMRVSLARALFLQPVCLLLDEPTNHLDMEAVLWLEDYLSKWNRILLLISHSQDFLNNVCTHMIDFTSRKKLQYYDGNYDQFVKTKSEMEENQWKQYRWEQEQIKSMKEYIARFGHGTAKNAKQAQSKEKVLQKMIRGGLTEKPVEDKPLNFKFSDPGHLPPPVLAFHDVSFGYPGCEPLYTNVNLGIDLDSRVALVGPNGAGKTTLVKLMAGELLPTKGDIRPHGHLKLGRFTQHFVDVLDVEMTPLEFFEQKYPGDPREEQRKYLGRFGVSGSMQVQKMKELSDGQKSRVVFAKLGRDVPHILLLDEPTNHLDMESIDALAKAVNEFQGGMILVSHDMRLISQVANEIWICDNKTITKYDGDIQSFKMNMRKDLGIDEKVKLQGDASVKKKTEDALAPKKEKKEQPKLEVVKPTRPKPADDATAVTTTSAASSAGSLEINASDDPPKNKYIPPHLRRKMESS
ncbi:ATP-binding cassette, subfamily F, member 2 [Fistulifera solaris]|uniref:ATP-binding cassette, subfamily F, member 2 n=1 Tax=Fistulifera solaris TaxID=1519565 RepID=A0A1Z5KDN9_FISSO|nr:ATP-binding cassette, subfamily F, member 2 [Fistulifera solaris]|eukprot:GAX24078.1 ATP-binding cassette, subfamily F, member 2 [Fistulifera solaris]